MDHDLHGTIHVSNAADAEVRAHEAARAYFGEQSYRLSITTHEQRTIGGQVLGYEVDYYAVAEDET